MAPLPARPKPTPTTEHTELRPLGKPIARHVDRGFETLVVSTGEDMRCEGERLESGADVRVQGASDPRRPWSAWFSSLPVGGADNNGAAGNGGFLVIRRPLPARGERQIAHVYLPAVCNGAPEHFRSRFPTPSRTRPIPRALAYWANGFAHHVSGQRLGRVRGGARPRALSRTRGEGGRRPVRSARRRDTERSSARPRTKANGQAEGRRGVKPAGRNGARRARVTAPRRDPSELARLMDTTTGMTSLQETLQTDRALLAATDEPATVALSELKPPSFKPHPWAAMMAALGRPVPLEPLAAAAPAAFYYVRFRSISHLIQLRERLDAGLAPALAGMGEGADYDLAARYEAELGLRQGPLDEAARPDGGRRPGGGGQRSLSARGQRPVLRLQGARAPRVRGGAGRHAGRVRRRARRAEVGDDRSPGNADHHHAIE